MDAKTFENPTFGKPQFDQGFGSAIARPVHVASEPVRDGAPVFTIGDLSREFAITLRALRFYEDKGLLSPRRDGMTRLYSESDRRRLAVILKGKHLGFTLAEIRLLVAAHDGEEGSLSLTRDRCLSQLAQLERQRSEIDAAIEELKSMANQLAA
ncbi:MerR family DNA-binding transcriptional regulator [Xanthobacter dioxanivorans]|uniref:MerR family DNA-binding transcriptional regulator n=1 Tax=Xanthobacter dioxanivorans TaxID=2528964 RepID=A0A974PQ03_9HYPH|nr:MerR family DNA-binding transcriptional regulator [Xanthobacter dioxanivorans]QRG07381.1 MerR family DNA-binding transcriptional regulator [Xanthobacter dioxanivorans]